MVWSLNLQDSLWSVMCRWVFIWSEKSTPRLCPPKFQVSMVTETPVQGMHSSVITALSPLVKHLCQVTGWSVTCHCRSVLLCPHCFAAGILFSQMLILREIRIKAISSGLPQCHSKPAWSPDLVTCLSFDLLLWLPFHLSLARANIIKRH